VDSPHILRVENPARPDEPAGLTHKATPEQYEEAVQAAGVKDSGLGREGLRNAIEDMTEIRILVVAQPG
jgi:acyl-CoA reductase-like NAD-dependent aldehyde dehydrogenase